MYCLANLKKINGIIKPNTSKSQAIRYLLIASQIHAKTIINNITYSGDVIVLIHALKLAGIKIILKKSKVIIYGGTFKNNKDVFDAGDSAAVFRFLIAVFLNKFDSFKITGTKQLFKRPLDEYITFFEKENIYYEIKDDVLYVKGKIKSKDIEISLSKSSQFASALAMTIPFNDVIYLKLKDIDTSYSYVLYTLFCLKDFKINYKKNNNTYEIEKLQNASSGYLLNIEPDYSNLIYYLILSIKNKIFLDNQVIPSRQPDYILFEYLKLLGFEPKIYKKYYYLNDFQQSEEEILLDFRNNPDLVMPFVMLGVYLNKTITFLNLKTLKYKESDRLSSIFTFLKQIGQKFTSGSDMEENDYITIYKTTQRNLKDLILDAKNDHRLIMSYTILSNLFETNIKIINCDKLSKSSPDFFQNLKKIGAKIICKRI